MPPPYPRPSDGMNDRLRKAMAEAIKRHRASRVGAHTPMATPTAGLYRGPDLGRIYGGR